MKIQYTREVAPDTRGGFFGGFKEPVKTVTQTKVEELPDGSAVPDGATQVKDNAPVHDWQ